MAKGGVRKESEIPCAAEQLEFIHSVSHTNWLITFFLLRMLAA